MLSHIIYASFKKYSLHICQGKGQEIFGDSFLCQSSVLEAREARSSYRLHGKALIKPKPPLFARIELDELIKFNSMYNCETSFNHNPFLSFENWYLKQKKDRRTMVVKTCLTIIH